MCDDKKGPEEYPFLYAIKRTPYTISVRGWKDLSPSLILLEYRLAKSPGTSWGGGVGGTGVGLWKDVGEPERSVGV